MTSAIPIAAHEAFCCHNETCRCKQSPESSAKQEKNGDKVDLAAAAELWVDVDPAHIEAPANFGVVAPGLYRSAFPQPANFSFINALGIRTVLCLVDDESLPRQYLHWIQSHGLILVRVGLPGHKEAFQDGVPVAKVVEALSAILDRNRHPILVHCNRGKHRTGTLIACLRKTAGWHVTRALDEYRRYSHPKERTTDMDFIEGFEPDSSITRQFRQAIASAHHHHHFVPSDQADNFSIYVTSGADGVVHATPRKSNKPSPVLPAQSPELSLPAFA